MNVHSVLTRLSAAFRWLFPAGGFWLRAAFLRALVEAWLIALVVLLAANHASQDLANFSLSHIIFFTSCASGIWMALRVRPVQGNSLRRILLKEALAGTLLGALLLAGVFLPLVLLNLAQIFQNSGIGLTVSAVFLACSGLAYYAFRGAIRLLSYWNNLRRHRLMWSLTNAHLSVVVFSALFAAVLFTAYTLITGSNLDLYAQLPPASRFLTRLVSTVLPIIGVFLILTAVALAVLLPPSAIFSFFFSRLLTRRLDHLIKAAQHFRSGDYAARVVTDGEDEIAQLQSDFNSMAETLQHTLEELNTANQGLREEQARVQELLQARRELVASVSHELRTPVATMRGYLDAAIDNPTPGHDLQADLEVMRREAVRLQTLIDDLFTLSRAEAHGLPLELRPVDVRSLIGERVSALAALAWQSGRVEIIADVPPDLPPALADPNRLEQVLVNLLRNAIRYTPPGGIVAVTASAEEDHLRIDVRDTGAGISVEDLPHIWERFYRGASPEADPSGGAGLGLALVKELTEAMGGSVCVESLPGQGSCFTIRFQAAEKARPQTAL